MWAMVAKEFRQLRRDRRTVAMMIVLPVVLLVVFGYAANFDVHAHPDRRGRARRTRRPRRRCRRRST